jgi:hypothetical protein
MAQTAADLLADTPPPAVTLGEVLYAQRNTAAPPTDFGAPAEVDYFASREW